LTRGAHERKGGREERKQETSLLDRGARRGGEDSKVREVSWDGKSGREQRGGYCGAGIWKIKNPTQKQKTPTASRVYRK